VWGAERGEASAAKREYTSITRAFYCIAPTSIAWRCVGGKGKVRPRAWEARGGQEKRH
jgi:hypothetical protein